MSKESPLYMKQFLNDLQIQISKSLKRNGSCIKKGSLRISSKVEIFLEKKFKVTKRIQPTNLLIFFGLDQNIVKDHNDIEPSTITDFKIKFGNKQVLNYNTRKNNFVTVNKNLNSSRIFHWEFIRVVQMTEMNGEDNLALDKRYEARTLEWRSMSN
jgi:hypothetical protein